MSFGEQLRHRREELQLSRAELAERLGVSRSAVGNYETGVSAPKEEILLQLFDALQVDPNYLYRDSFRADTAFTCSNEERVLLQKYRALHPVGRQAVYALVNSLQIYQEELEGQQLPAEVRTIPLYCCPAAAGYAAPVFGEDYEPIEVTGDVPPGAELAVRIQGDSMEPYIADGSVVYVNHDPLQNGDVGIFCVDGDMLCKQYYRDPLGMVYLFSLNRKRADADVTFFQGSGRSLTCFGRVIMHTPPLPR
ncbi:MAG: LexA family transcriptional regulator [Clostridiales bacterium]|nr:LexA family transcriptional regulator [Candidatus Cacconaster stercorequi]